MSITLALSKGRIFDETLPLLKAAGIEVTEDPERSRKLILATTRPDVRVVLVRATDVPTYVQHGGADLGVAGLDILLEQGETEVSILSRLQAHVRGLLVAADLSVLGQATKERLSREIGVHPFAAAKLISQCRHFKPHELERLYVKLIDADEQLKRGGWPKARAALDLFLADIAKEPA